MTGSAGSKSVFSLWSVGGVTLCSMLQMVLQFVFVVWLARRFGNSPEMDVFSAVSVWPIVISSALVGPVPMVLVPELVRMREQGNGQRADRLVKWINGIVLASCLLLAVLSLTFAEPLCQLLFGGFDEAQLRLATTLLRCLCWLLPLNAAIGMWQAMLQAERRYWVAAVSNVVGVALTLGVVIARPNFDLSLVSWSLVIGSGAAVLFLAMALFGRPRRSEQIHEAIGGAQHLGVSADLLRFVLLLLPLLFASLYARIDPLVDRSVASYLTQGSVSELGYAQRLVVAFLTLTVSGLSAVVFPQLAALAVRRDEHLAQLLARAWRFLILLLVPCCVAVWCYAGPLVSDLFERGSFTPDATQSVAMLLRILMCVVIGGAICEVAGKALYSVGDTRLPALIGVVCFTLGVGAKIVLSQRWGRLESLGVPRSITSQVLC